MPGPKPGARPRPMGGFNPGMGDSNEHLDEAAFKAAGQQQQLTQQQASTQPASGKAGTNPLLSQGDAAESSAKGPAQPDKAREMGNVKQELVDRPLSDIKKELAKFFDLQLLFNVNSEDSPEEQMKKKSLHKRFQKLTQEQQEVAQKNYQETMKKKQLEEEEEERQKQEEEAQQQADIAPPSSTKKGPVGPASGQSKKQKSQSMLQQSRQGLSSAGKKH